MNTDTVALAGAVLVVVGVLVAVGGLAACAPIAVAFAGAAASLAGVVLVRRVYRRNH